MRRLPIRPAAETHSIRMAKLERLPQLAFRSKSIGQFGVVPCWPPLVGHVLHPDFLRRHGCLVSGEHSRPDCPIQPDQCGDFCADFCSTRRITKWRNPAKPFYFGPLRFRASGFKPCWGRLPPLLPEIDATVQLPPGREPGPMGSTGLLAVAELHGCRKVRGNISN